MVIYFSRKGIIKFQDELTTLENRLKDLKSKTQNTVETGGDQWHDNPALYGLMSDMRALNGRLGEYYNIRSQAVLVDYPSKPEEVCLGSTVIFEENQHKKVFHIAGFGESDPDRNIIAYNTPIGKSIIGKKPREIVDILIAKKQRLLRILEVKPYDESFKL